MFFALCCVVSLVGIGGLLSYPICQNEVPPKIGRVKHYFQHICCLSGCAPFFFRIIPGCGSECVGPFPACLSFAFSVGLHFCAPVVKPLSAGCAFLFGWERLRGIRDINVLFVLSRVYGFSSGRRKFPLWHVGQAVRFRPVLSAIRPFPLLPTSRRHPALFLFCLPPP